MRLIVVAALIGMSAVGRADAPSADWQKIRDKQPAALHLKLTLPRDHFFQGEEIDATLDFSNTDPAKKVSLCVGVGSPGAVFHATDDKNVDAPDPRQWEEEWLPHTVSGPVGFHELGTYSLELPVNDSLAFAHPGVYRVYAEASVINGPAMTSRDRSDMVSDPVTITITPLDAATGKSVIDEAMQILGNRTDQNEGYLRGFAKLEYLQSSAALDQLIALLGDSQSTQFAQNALFEMPDPGEAARRILDAASHGKLVLDDNGGLTYGSLSAAHLLRGTSPQDFPEPEREKRFEAFAKERDAARENLMQVQLQATGGHGAAHVEALWAAFRNEVVHHDPSLSTDDAGPARSALLPHQLELSDEAVTQVLEDWPYWGLEGFLPLVKREAGPPHQRLTALIGWADLDPEGARPLIIREFNGMDSRFFTGNYPASIVLPAIKPMPLPQFDSLFRAKLEASHGSAFPIIPVIAAFGSSALLPDVEKAWHAYGKTPQGNWDSGILTCLFRYWLRCDPEGGSAAMEKEMSARGREGWGLLSTVLRDWPIHDARPVLKWALTSPEPRLSAQALFLIEKHGDDSWDDTILAAMDRINGDKGMYRAVVYDARLYLANPAFHFTADQRKRLQALAAEPVPN